jgi:hypothetical protein
MVKYHYSQNKTIIIAKREQWTQSCNTRLTLQYVCKARIFIRHVYVCLCIDVAWCSFHSEVFSFYYLIISIISAMFFLSSVNIYINSASIIIFLLGISSLRCGRYNSVCMLFHLSIYSPNKQRTCALYTCSITN